MMPRVKRCLTKFYITVFLPKTYVCYSVNRIPIDIFTYLPLPVNE